MLERQQPAKVGSALKTIAARLRGIDKANNLPKLSRLLGEVGVKVESASGGFRNIYDILGDLSDALAGSNDEFQKQLILEELAGKRRANILAGLLNNFQKAREVVSKTSDSINDATESQNKLLDTSAGVISQMSGNWSVFADNIIESDLVKESLTAINNKLKNINDTMALQEDMEINFGKIGMDSFEDDFEMAAFQGMSMSEFLFGMTESQFLEKNSKFWKDLNDSTEEGLESLGTEITPMANDFNLAVAEAERLRNLIDGINVMTAEGNEGRRLQGYKEALVEQEVVIQKASRALGEYGIVGSEVDEVIDYIADNTYRLISAQEDEVDAVEKVTEALFTQSSVFEWYAKRFSDLTDDQKADMESMVDTDIDATLIRIQASKDRIEALETEGFVLSKLYRAQLRLGAEKTKMSNMDYWDASVADRLSGDWYKEPDDFKDLGALETEMANLDNLISKYDNAKSVKDDYFGDTDSSKDSAKELAEPLSILEIALRDVRQEVDLLDSKLSRTEGHQAQLDIINQLIIKREAEKVAIDNLAVAKNKEMKAEKKDKALKQDLMEEYQKLLVESDKTQTSIYKLEQSMVDLNDTQSDLVKSNVSKNVAKMREEYDEYFEDQKESYEDDLDEFKLAQQKRLDIIDESLKKLKDKYDDEKFVDDEGEILDKIAKLEKEKLKLRIATETNDLQAKKRVSEIEEQLIDENEQLSDMRRDREYDLEEDALNDKKDRIKEETTERERAYDRDIKELEDYQERVETRLDGFEENWENFANTLGMDLENGMLPSIANISSELSKLMSEYSEMEQLSFDDAVDIYGGSSSGGIEGTKGSDSLTRDEWDAIMSPYTGGSSSSSSSSSSSNSSDSMISSTGKSRSQISDEYNDKHGHRPDSGIIDAIKSTGGTFHDGGVAGSGSFKGMNGIEALEYGLKGNEIGAVLEKGEGIFTQPQMKDIASGGDSIGNMINIENLQVTASNSYDVEQFGSDLAKGAKKEMLKKGGV